MERILTTQERKGLQAVSDLQDRMYPVQKGDLPGIGDATLHNLEALGLVAYVRTEHHTEGYLVTGKGERVMYGKTMKDILDAGGVHLPLKIWKVDTE